MQKRGFKISIAVIAGFAAAAAAVAALGYLSLAYTDAALNYTNSYSKGVIWDVGQRVDALLDLELKSLKESLSGYSHSDELYAYIKSGCRKYSSWYKNKFGTGSSFDQGGIRAAVINADGKILAGSAVPEELFDSLSSSRFLQAALAGESNAGYAVSGGDLYSLAVVPVSPTFDMSAVSGALLAVREIGVDKLKVMEKNLGVSLALATRDKLVYRGSHDPISSQPAFEPPLFNKSIKFGYTQKILQSKRGMALPRLIKDYSVNNAALLWVIMENRPFVEFVNRFLSLERSMVPVVSVAALLIGFAVCFAVYFFLSRSIKKILSQPVSTPLDDTGRVRRVVKEVDYVHRAISKLQKRYARLHEVKDSIFNSMEEGYQLIDSSGRTREVNPALCAFAGKTRTLFKAEEDPFFYLDEEGRTRAHEFVSLLNSGETVIKNGFDCRLNPVCGSDSKVSVRLGVIELKELRDYLITVLILDNEEDETARVDAQEFEKLKVLAKFAGGAAHNMNNLLTGIKSALSVLDGHMVDATPEMRAKMMETIKDSSEKAVELTRELLQMSRIKQGRSIRCPVNVTKIVREVVRMAASLPEGPNYSFDLAVPDGPVIALAEESGLHQVLLNLVANAMDAMPNPGPIRIKVIQIDSINGPIASIIVQDYGQGMPEEVKRRIFEPFFSTKADRPRKGTIGGSGLGLSSALALVESWGGTIECGTDLGRGSTFTVSLQAAETFEESAGDVTAEPSPHGNH